VIGTVAAHGDFERLHHHLRDDLCAHDVTANERDLLVAECLAGAIGREAGAIWNAKLPITLPDWNTVVGRPKPLLTPSRSHGAEAMATMAV
jgi:hypothetical protein